MREYMRAGDPHRFSNQLDESMIQCLIDRLENRAKDTVFNRLFDQYISKLDLLKSARVLEVGCGTGAVTRALVHRNNFTSKMIGVDQCPAFIKAAQSFAHEEGIEKSVEFIVDDVHDLHIEDESMDVVIAHTLISHVTDPKKVLKEIVRVVRKKGSIAIFDGDYMSLTYAYPDREFGRKMDRALALATFNNPLIIRDLVRLLPEMGLKIKETFSNVVSEIGNASYFKSFAQTYAPLVAKDGLLPKEDVDDWLSKQNAAMQDGTFFASCNYYTYLVQRI